MTEPLEAGRLTAYLLGRLSTEDEEAVESEYFHAPGAWERLQAVEDDLIDAYAAGRLGGDDARRFEEHFLNSPERRERVAFAKALRTLVAQTAGRPVSRRRSFLPQLAAVLPVALAAGWLFTSVRDLRTELARSRERQVGQEREAAEHRARIASLEQELATRGRNVSGTTTWRLAPGLERDAAPAAVTVPSDATAVCLRLSLGPAAPAGLFVARVETAEGRVLAALHGLRARQSDGSAVDVVVPGASLSPGTYVVVLQAGRPLELVDTYHLRVLAQ